MSAFAIRQRHSPIGVGSILPMIRMQRAAGLDKLCPQLGTEHLTGQEVLLRPLRCLPLSLALPLSTGTGTGTRTITITITLPITT